MDTSILNRRRPPIASLFRFAIAGLSQHLAPRGESASRSTSPRSPLQRFARFAAAALAALALHAAPALARVDVAAQANGGVATASSTWSSSFAASGANDGDRRGANWAGGGGWSDGSPGAFPDWLQVAFNGSKTIGEIDVVTVQDDYRAPVDPTLATTFSAYGITSFVVQYWTGSAWAAVPNGTVTGNDRVWRQFTFPPITTDRIRVLVNGSPDGFSRVTELEAWSADNAGNVPPTIAVTAPASGASFPAPANITLTADAADSGGTIAKVEFFQNGAKIGESLAAPYTLTWDNVDAGTYTLTANATDDLGAITASGPVGVIVTRATPSSVNVAAQANGGVATASSAWSSAFAASGANDGERSGADWGNGGGWSDGNPGTFPDWLQVAFSGAKTIGEIDVFTVQDNYRAPGDPTLATTFSLYGIRSFVVQYWTGTTWNLVPNASVAGNNRVWRQFTFPPITTDRIRVLVNGSPDGFSRITELEAWSAGAGGNAAPTASLTAPADGASYTAPASVTLTADAADSDGTIARVEFFQNGSKVGEALAAPYTFTWTNVAAGSYALTAIATDDTGAGTTSTPIGITVASAANSVNVAAQTNGGVATASGSYSSAFGPNGVNDGDRKGANWGDGGGWSDGNAGTFPDWLQVAFNGAKTIGEIDVFTVQDNYRAPVDPTLATTFSLYGITSYVVQYWTGSAWTAVPGGTVTGNNRVWRQFTFPSITTDRIRVLVNGSSDGYSRLTELEAWSSDGAGNASPTVSLSAPADGTSYATPANVTLTAAAADSDGTVAKVEFFQNGTKIGEALAAPYTLTWAGVTAGGYTLTAVATDDAGATTASAPIGITVTSATSSVNVAAQSNGGVATTSSAYSSAYGPAGANDGDRKGTNWANGGGWSDGNPGVFPDWLQVVFNGSKTIGEIDLFTAQDDYRAPADPTPSTRFSLYGITSFVVQYWTGSAWAAVPGGTVTGNNLVWRQFIFPAISTDRIRVLVNGSPDGFSRITELEAWSTDVPVNAPPAVSLTVPMNGASFTAPASIAITADAADDDGNVSKVEFFGNGAKIGEAPTPPYTFTWTNVPVGNYSLTAVATDDVGGATTSNAVAITVEAAATGDLSGLVNLLASLPEGNWAQVNLNLFSDVWTPPDLRPLLGSSNPAPASIIDAWSGFAWDTKRGDLILYGGGHANYPGNDVYRWHGSTRVWERASLPSEIAQDLSGEWQAADGPDHAPGSAHTYDNNLYLPVIDRFVTFGGGLYGSGGPYTKPTAPGSSVNRTTGPYFFDPSKADGNEVGGTTGSHVKRVAPHPEIAGGNMWENRDIYGNLPGSPPFAAAFVNGMTAYAQENGKDVVYVATRIGGGTDSSLFRYTVNDLADPTADTWEHVGQFYNGVGDQGAGAYDPVAKLFVMTGDNSKPFVFWSLASPGPQNRDAMILPLDPSGEFAAALATRRVRNYGLDFDPVRRRFLAWGGDGTVWSLRGPDTPGPEGWTITREPEPTSATPTSDIGTGTLGRWKYIPNLDAFMLLQRPNEGNIWLYKPIGWKNPLASNVLPDVAVTAPLGGDVFVGPASIALRASAQDTGGQVTRVEYYNGAQLIGQATSPPYGLTWTGVAAGDYAITGRAYDNTGASSMSDPVLVTVTPNDAGPVNVAAHANGGVASASSTYPGGGYPASTVIDGDRSGMDWSVGGGWGDNTVNQYPDWVQVQFDGVQPLQEVDVFTLQDDLSAPTAPTSTMTFSRYGIVDFEVQYWNGASWIDVPGGNITGNNLVWRKLTFPTISTDRIRVSVTRAMVDYSRIVEIEAWSGLP